VAQIFFQKGRAWPKCPNGKYATVKSYCCQIRFPLIEHVFWSWSCSSKMSKSWSWSCQKSYWRHWCMYASHTDITDVCMHVILTSCHTHITDVCMHVSKSLIRTAYVLCVVWKVNFSGLIRCKTSCSVTRPWPSYSAPMWLRQKSRFNNLYYVLIRCVLTMCEKHVRDSSNGQLLGK